MEPTRKDRRPSRLDVSSFLSKLNMLASPLLTSSERKGKYLYAGIEKFNFECAVLHFSFLPDQLVQAVFLHHTLALRVGVHAVVFARRGAVDANAKANRLAILARSQNEMQVARMKPEEHFPWGGHQRRMLIAHSPVSGESPLVDGQARRSRVRLWCVFTNRLRRRVILLPRVANVRLRRRDVLESRFGLRAGRSHLHQAAGLQVRILLA